MADESTVIQDTESSSDDIGDVSLDIMNADATEETTEPSPVEDKTTENTSDEEQEQSPDSTETTETDEEAPAEDETEAEPDLKGMSRKERAEYYSQQRADVAERRKVEQSISQAYQPQTLDELKEAYLNEGYGDAEATLLARDDIREQRSQIAEATAKIAEFNADLRVDSFEAQQKYDWMNPAKTEVFDKDLANHAADLFTQGITTDPRTGQIIDAKMTPSQVADIVNRIYESGVKKASVKAQKAAEQQMASVAPPSSTRQPVKTGNSLSDMEERLKNITF